jgi:hypothetical protein
MANVHRGLDLCTFKTQKVDHTVHKKSSKNNINPRFLVDKLALTITGAGGAAALPVFGPLFLLAQPPAFPSLHDSW